MEISNDILLGNEVIGTVTFRKVGLYYHFRCSCNLTGEVVFKIIATCENKNVSLGVCVPKDRVFGLEKKVPVKQLGEGAMTFRAVPNRPDTSTAFVPIKPEEPFAYIERLQNSHLKRHGDTIGVILSEEC